MVGQMPPSGTVFLKRETRTRLTGVKAEEMKTMRLALLFALIMLWFSTARPVTASAVHYRLTACNGTIAECQATTAEEADDVEYLMDSEIHRRFLQSQNTLPYRVFDENRPTCDTGRGKGYLINGKCFPALSGNPRSRGCQRQYYCRSPSSNVV